MLFEGFEQVQLGIIRSKIVPFKCIRLQNAKNLLKTEVQLPHPHYISYRAILSLHFQKQFERVTPYNQSIFTPTTLIRLLIDKKRWIKVWTDLKKTAQQYKSNKKIEAQ